MSPTAAAVRIVCGVGCTNSPKLLLFDSVKAVAIESMYACEEGKAATTFDLGVRKPSRESIDDFARSSSTSCSSDRPQGYSVVAFDNYVKVPNHLGLSF